MDNKEKANVINVWGLANIGCTMENPTFQMLVQDDGKAKEAETVTENNDKPQTQVDGEEGVNNEGPAEEERFHFIHPEIEDEEAWRIHKAIKRLVAHQKVPEICAYLKEKKQEGKLYLPPNPSFVYEELKRLGMPTGDGYSDKYFAGCYKNITISKD